MTINGALRIVTDALRPDLGGAAGAESRTALDDWVPAIQLANDHLVAPAMYSALSRADALDRLPADVGDYLGLLHQANDARNRALHGQATELIHTLNRAGVSPMLLKGVLALFLDHYDDNGARIVGDLDLLVRREDLPAAIDALRVLGYTIGTLYQPLDQPLQHDPLQHAYAEFVRHGDPGAVDLHVELVDASRLLPAADVWRRAQWHKNDGIAYFVPSPVDALLHNLWHAQLHYLGEFYRGTLNLRQLYDFVRLAERVGAAVDWQFIATTASRHHAETALHAYLWAAHDLLGMPWPLAVSPSMASRLQYFRTRLQMEFPALAQAYLPWANLRAAFAPHRMAALYGEGSALATLRLRHFAQFLRKTERPTIFGRLFRPG